MVVPKAIKASSGSLIFLHKKLTINHLNKNKIILSHKKNRYIFNTKAVKIRLAPVH